MAYINSLLQFPPDWGRVWEKYFGNTLFEDQFSLLSSMHVTSILAIY